MTAADCPLGFRVVGPVSEERRLVDAAAAFAAHCSADPRSQPENECYLSAFNYGADFRTHLTQRGTPKGFNGPCWSPHLWLDIDRDDLGVALAHARGVANFALFRYSQFGDDDLLYFFSGRRGFHIGIPLTHRPPPGGEFHTICRRLAGWLAAESEVVIDAGVYDKVRLLRAPNSRHPKTALHKRRLTYHELMNLTADRIRELATEPLGFEVPAVTAVPGLLASDWAGAEAALREQQRDRAERPSGGHRLQRATMEFITAGAPEGERHTRLFRAAGDLRAHGAPRELVHALLAEQALDSGMPPSEVTRTINCGIENSDAKDAGGDA